MLDVHCSTWQVRCQCMYIVHYMAAAAVLQLLLGALCWQCLWLILGRQCQALTGRAADVALYLTGLGEAPVTLLKVRWNVALINHQVGVSISDVSEDSILVTLLSALPPTLRNLDISGE